MKSRFIVILAIVVAAVCAVAAWFLQSTPPPVMPAIATATPERFSRPPELPPPVSTPNTPAASTPAAPEMRPAINAPPLAEWEAKIEKVLSANPDNSEAANSATAQMLINLLPTLPPDGQAEAAQHISNLLADKDYARVLPIVKNPSMPEPVLDVLVTDLMNRDDSVKLPALLEIAKIPNHPHHEEAATDLQIFLDGDFGTDWAKWDSSLKAYLKKQAAESAAADAGAVPAPAKP